MSIENTDLTRKPLHATPVIYDWLRLIFAFALVVFLYFAIKEHWFWDRRVDGMLYFVPTFVIPFFFGLWGWMAVNNSMSRVSEHQKDFLLIDVAPELFAACAIVSAVGAVLGILTLSFLIMFFPPLAILFMFVLAVYATGIAFCIRGRFWIFVATAWCLLIAEGQVFWGIAEIFDK